MASLSWEKASMILNLPLDASISDIRGAYRRMAKATHPDLNPVNDSEQFRLVREAYMVMLRNAPRSDHGTHEIDEPMTTGDPDELTPVVYRKSRWSRLCQWWYQQTHHHRNIRTSRLMQSRQL